MFFISIIFEILDILPTCLYLLNFVLSIDLKTVLSFAVVSVFRNIACDTVVGF